MLRVLSSLSEIPRAQWDACANPGWPSDRPLESGTAGPNPYDPFLSHDFLWALEESGAATGETGWFSRHLVMDDSDGVPVAIMPCYVKGHSMGEYVFDHGWADAYQRSGGRYYPKLQTSIPFTPVTGRRLLVRDDRDDNSNYRNVLATAGIELARQLEVSSLHVTFAQKSDWQLLGEHGYLLRNDQQFHFVNDGYRDFDDFLSALASRKRKTIRRERRGACESGLEIVELTGSDLTEEVWDAFFEFYMDTGARKYGQPYLNRRFFSLISERMSDRLLLVMARRGDRYVAGALNVIGSHTLFGRYWGAVEDVPFLHLSCVITAPWTGVLRTVSTQSKPAPRASTSWLAGISRPRHTQHTG